MKGICKIDLLFTFIGHSNFANDMKEEVTNLTSLAEGIRNNENQVYRLTDEVSNLTELVKGMMNNERTFQKRVLTELGRIFY